jgi:hypothetical protein
MKLIQDDI